METKVCSQCGEVKTLNDFYQKKVIKRHNQNVKLVLTNIVLIGGLIRK